MKLRRPLTGFKSAAQLKTKPAFWNFDSSSSLSSEDARFLELKSYYSRPSGKGRFGKRPLSLSESGYSNDSNSNSNDSGIDFNSYESQSQLSWGSEDAHIGRSNSISIPTGFPPRFPIGSYGKENEGKSAFQYCLLDLKGNETGEAEMEDDYDPLVFLSQAVSLQKELCQEFVKEDPKVEQVAVGFNSSEGSLLDISAARFLLPEKAQQNISSTMRMSPDSSDQVTTVVTQSPILVPGSHSPTSNSPTSTMSPSPLKRPRFSYLPAAPGKGVGLKLRNQNQNVRGSIGKRLPPGTAPTLSSALSCVSRDGRVQLQIVAQPEEQHRARYQTEGSRGAIKDRKGNGFPTVKLVGYDKPATLQIFIGCDQGKVSPHMFYQACKVTGKSSTPCIEKKVEGTVVIEIEFEPPKDMVISCDCVGILKERNVDVEQRFPFHHAAQSRKKSTKCRMIFRTTIINSQGLEETLQLSSNAILCTQPPGHPEICKQSTHESPAKGGHELFVIGKNFLKDTKVLFQEEDGDDHILWEVMSEPLKDYLQQNHLICVIPPYKIQNIMMPVECKVTIVSGGKQSEPIRFTYLPNLAAAQYGISTSNAISNASNSVLQDAMAQSMSQSQMSMSLNIQAANAANDDGSNMSHTLSPVQLGPQQAPLSLPTSPTRTMAPMQFPENMHSVPAAQERQVVNELQSILDQSVRQQNQQGQMNSGRPDQMIIKTEGAFNPMHQTPISTSQVPLDLQFPSAVVPVSTVEPSNTMIPSQMSFGDPTVVSSPSFVPASSLSCVPPSGPMQLTRQGSMEMVNVEQQMLTELLPNSHSSMPSTEAMTTAVSAPQSTNSLPISCQSVGNAISVRSNGMCRVGGLIKMEEGSVINVPPMTSTVSINTVTVSVTPSQGEGGPVMSMAPQGYISADLQAHQGTLTQALTQMSDNELMNYINPSCFEHNVPLV